MWARATVNSNARNPETAQSIDERAEIDFHVLMQAATAGALSRTRGDRPPSSSDFSKEPFREGGRPGRLG
jgi:hypothetical protein